MNEPLAQRLRPKTLADVCGQQHLLAEGQVFRRTIESGRIPNMIFYGPSGTGKTTVARIIAENSGMTLHKLNGTSCGTGDIKAVLKDIQSGKFARDFILEARANYPMFMATRRNEANHQLEQVGKELRGMMTWLKKDKKD